MDAEDFELELKNPSTEAMRRGSSAVQLVNNHRRRSLMDADLAQRMGAATALEVRASGIGTHADRLGYQCGGWTKNRQRSGGRITIEGKEDKLLQAETKSGTEVTISSSSPSQDPGTTSGNEVTISSSSQDSETTRRNEGSNNKFLSVMKIMDEQDMGKQLLGIAIPMGVAPVLSASPIVQTTEMKIVLSSLSFAVAFICNGLLLRKIVTKMSTVLLLLGSSLMLLSFFSLIGLFLPLNLKWIPLLCWLVSLIPFAMYAYWAYFRQGEKDPERGQ